METEELDSGSDSFIPPLIHSKNDYRNLLWISNILGTGDTEIIWTLALQCSGRDSHVGKTCNIVYTYKNKYES